MNQKHLGDVFDHWKGSVIERIGDRTLGVLPMFTDRKKWTSRQVSAYAKLLHRRASDILKQREIFSKESRLGYFDKLGNEDLFVDPDTGIAPEERAKEKHIRPSEIAKLLRQSETRMLLIFQFSSPRIDKFSGKLKLLRSCNGLRRCAMFAYDAGFVSMVVISRSDSRVAEASRRLRSWPGPAAKKRIIR